MDTTFVGRGGMKEKERLLQKKRHNVLHPHRQTVSKKKRRGERRGNQTVKKTKTTCMEKHTSLYRPVRPSGRSCVSPIYVISQRAQSIRSSEPIKSPVASVTLWRYWDQVDSRVMLVNSPPSAPVRAHVIALAPEAPGPAAEPGLGLAPELGPGPELAV